MATTFQQVSDKLAPHPVICWLAVMLIPFVALAVVYAAFGALVDTGRLKKIEACVADPGKPDCVGKERPQQAGAAQKSDAAETKPTPAKSMAAETAARGAFALTSAALLIAATLALAVGALQLPIREIDENTPAEHPKIHIVAAVLLTLAGGLWGAFDCDRILTGFAMVRRLTPDDQWLWVVMRLNVVFGYGVSGTLLAALGSVVDEKGGTAAERLTRLQLVLLLGAVVFLAACACERALVDIVLLPLGEAAKDVKPAFESLLTLWGFGGAAYLTAAIGIGYLALRIQAPQPNPEARQGSALAITTPAGDELKALGWILNIMVALSPAALGAIFKFTFGPPPM